MANRQGTIEVERVYLNGVIESIEPLSEEWHKAHARNGEKCYKMVSKYENPLDSDNPLVVENWPCDEGILEYNSGDELKKDPFEIFEGHVYNVFAHPSGHNTVEGLMGRSNGAEPIIMVDSINTIYEGERCGWPYNPFYDDDGKYIGD